MLWKIPQKEMGVFHIIRARSGLTTILFGVSVLIFSQFSSDVYGWLMAIVISAVSFWGLVCYNISIKYTEVSQSITVTTASCIFGVLTSILVYNEPLTWKLFVAIASIVLGLFLIEKKSPILKWTKGTLFALLASFFWGTTFALFKIPIERIGSLNFSFSLEITVFCSSVLILLFSKQKINRKPSRKSLSTIIVLAVLGYFGVMCYNIAINLVPDVSVLAVMGSATPVVTIVLSHLFLKEKLTMLQYLGVVFILSASLLLVLPI